MNAREFKPTAVEWAASQRDMTFIERMDVALRRMAFGTDQRKQLYRTLAILMRSGKLMIDAIDDLYQIHSDGGQKPKRPIAMILAEVHSGLDEGATFSHAIRRYVGFDEYAVLSAGEAAGDLIGTFKDATRVAEAKSRMIKAVAMGVAYPILLAINLAVLLSVIDQKLVPALQSIADPSKWTGAAMVLYYLSKFVRLLGLPIVAMVVVGGAAFLYSLPRLTGEVRYHLDKCVGFNVYRAMNGCIFLMSIASQLRHGVKQHSALKEMASVASPYMHERIAATIAGSANGVTLGEALDRAGFDFPDRESIRVVKALGTSDGFENALSEYAEEWIERTVIQVERLMRLFFYLVLVLVGATMLCVLFGTQGIKEALEASYR
ncbi:type II secretion system F family protein [Stenotrophomonas maltophilia]|uniref:type II secretion system F family protein n=1 Tax=Stenotrophomonas maltophilia TaxID=40324 RepID=UPI000C15F717|nr:type II secretion system F family protein [Stenotrophomonas maltophilia]RRU72118.1 hypothetical protein EGJ89_09915 [Stenotrophomonas maltophilia]